MKDESSLIEPQAPQDPLKGLRFSCWESPCQERSVLSQGGRCHGTIRKSPGFPQARALAQSLNESMIPAGGIGLRPFSMFALFQ